MSGWEDLDWSKFGMASGLGGAASGLGSLFMGGGKDPYDAASSFYNRIPGAVSPYYSPYQQAGQNALGQLQGQYSQLTGGLPGLQGQYNGLMNDPSGMYNKLAGGYHQSPGFQFQMGQGMNAANNAAAAGGMAGSPQHQQQAATMAEGLANQDFGNYMDRSMNLYGQGLKGNQGLYNQGLSGLQGINQMGFSANDQMARIMSDMLSQQGQMKFAGQAARNQSQGQGWGDLFGGLASLAAFM